MVQDNYEIFRVLCTELVKREVKVPETYITGPLMLRRIISVIWSGEERMAALQKYDEASLQLGRERRSDSGPSSTP